MADLSDTLGHTRRSLVRTTQQVRLQPRQLHLPSSRCSHDTAACTADHLQ
jgi:hypothetical protein